MIFKLFEVDGRQLLVHRDTNDDDEPCLRITVELPGMQSAVSLGYDDTDEGRRLRDEAFDKFDQATAQRHFDRLADWFGGEVLV